MSETRRVDMSETVPILRTERLILRKLEIADAPDIQEHFPHWEIVQYLNVPWPYPEDGALRYIRDSVIPSMQLGGSWQWSVRLRTDPPSLVGVVGLNERAPDDNRGYWIGRAWQRRGLAEEASCAITDFWFDQLGHSVLRESKAAANESSKRISERQGMTLVSEVIRDHVSGRLNAEIWEITQEGWSAYRRRRLTQTQG